jgi:hypothetical protein
MVRLQMANRSGENGPAVVAEVKSEVQLLSVSLTGPPACARKNMIGGTLSLMVRRYNVVPMGIGTIVKISSA